MRSVDAPVHWFVASRTPPSNCFLLFCACSRWCSPEGKFQHCGSLFFGGLSFFDCRLPGLATCSSPLPQARRSLADSRRGKRERKQRDSEETTRVPTGNAGIVVSEQQNAFLLVEHLESFDSVAGLV
jgi:hypothetical protein